MGLRVGRYETLAEIASGGMATVHLARAVGAGGFERLFALKMMHPHIAKEPEFVSMFLDEARLAARIRHPNVVGTIDIIEAEQGLAIVMDYVEGPSLSAAARKLRKREQTLPVDIALRIFLDALAGLDAAHELTGPDGESLKLVHRDVSPQNLLIGVDGITRITDFGVAHAESRLQSTRGSQVKGKLGYMTPEQIAGEKVDRRCDVYAAGAVFWEMLTGQKLFRGDNDAAIVAQIAGGVKQTPREVVPTVPASVDRACMRALRYNPGERFPTAAAFAEALESAAASVGMRIATHKVVATYVKELRAHRPPAELPPAAPESSPSSPNLDSVSKPYTPISAVASGAMLAHPPQLGDPNVDSVVSTIGEARSGSTKIDAVLSQPGGTRPRSRGALWAVLAAAVVGVGLAVLFTPRAAEVEATTQADAPPPPGDEVATGAAAPHGALAWSSRRAPPPAWSAWPPLRPARPT
jgi:serine/threonine protein kinase